MLAVLPFFFLVIIPVSTFFGLLMLFLIYDLLCSLLSVSAVFSLAYKLQPAIIFIDEVDSFLGQRRSTDHEAMANMKTEFMALWDGFSTDSKLNSSSFGLV